MDIREIVEQIKDDEGYREWSYFDNDQYTWGYGTKAPGPDHRIGRDEADIALWQRVAIAIRDYYILFRYTTTEINEARQQALVNMLYNIGRPKMVKFRNMLAAIEAGLWHEVAAHAMDSLWYKQVGSRAERIVQELRTGVKEST